MKGATRRWQGYVSDEIRGEVVVQHIVQIGDVNSTVHHICRDQELGLAAFETVQHLLAHRLRHLAVQEVDAKLFHVALLLLLLLLLRLLRRLLRQLLSRARTLRRTLLPVLDLISAACAHIANEVDQKLARLHLVYEDHRDGTLPHALLLVLLHHILRLTPPPSAHADEVHGLAQLLVLAAQLHVLCDQRVQRHDAARVCESLPPAALTHHDRVVRHFYVVALGTPPFHRVLDLHRSMR